VSPFAKGDDCGAFKAPVYAPKARRPSQIGILLAKFLGGEINPSVASLK